MATWTNYFHNHIVWSLQNYDFCPRCLIFFSLTFDAPPKLVISYAFDQIGRSGAKNRAIQIVTYPTKIVETPFEEIQAPTSNNGTPIPTVLELNTDHFTANTTIFAWEKIMIDGNLTTATDVNVEIIAPEIIVKGGNIGSGIRLKQGFYPNDCSPLNPVGSARVATFCESSKYQANQSKHPRLADDTPATEKPTTSPIAFQAYPNPFTNTFNIEFELETEGETSLVIYDALGRVVETVLMNDNVANGKHQYQINGENLESGLYYATLQHSGGTQTIKIMKQ